jgi:hypothetical protein
MFDLTVSFEFLNFSFQICLLFVPEMSASITSYIVQITYTTLAWILYPLHFSLLEERGVYRVLVGKPEGSRPLGRPRRRWEDNIRMDLQEVGCGGRELTGLAQVRDRWHVIVNAVMNFRVP